MILALMTYRVCGVMHIETVMTGETDVTDGKAVVHVSLVGTWTGAWPVARPARTTMDARHPLYARVQATGEGVRLSLWPIPQGAIAPTDFPDLDALHNAMAHLRAGAFSGHEIRISGLRVVHKQRLSRSLLFFGLRAPDGRLLECVLRRGILMGDHARIGDAAALGDVIAVTGMVELSKGRLSVHARQIETKESWVSLYGTKCIFRDDAAHMESPTSEPTTRGQPGPWSPRFADRGQLVLLQAVVSHAPRVRDYVALTHEVVPLGIVAPISGPHMGRDERGVVLRSLQPASLIRDVLHDGAVARFIQRWYVLDDLAPTVTAAADGLTAALRAIAQARAPGDSGPVEVRIQAFPRSLEAHLIAALRLGGAVELNPRASCLVCAAYIYGAVAYGVADGRSTFREAFDDGVNGTGVSQRPHHVRPGRTAPQQQPADATVPRPLAEIEPSADSSGGGHVSRAFYKLREVASRLQIRLDVAHAIDVGASPGGWTTCLVQSGCGRVTAVDPGLLFLPPAVEASGRVQHMRMKIEEALPLLQAQEAPDAVQLDMLVCDMNAPPADVINIVRTALPLLRHGALLVLTFKNSFARRAEWHKALDAGLHELRRFADGVQVVHLLANTGKETTVVGTVGSNLASSDAEAVDDAHAWMAASWQRARMIAGRC